MASDDLQIDPSLQNLNQVASGIADLTAHGSHGVIGTQYLRDLVETATNVVSEDSMVQKECNDGTVNDARLQDFSLEARKRNHGLYVDAWGSNTQEQVADGHRKKRSKREKRNDNDVSRSTPQGPSIAPDTTLARLPADQPAPAIFRTPTGKKSTRLAVAKEFQNLELCSESFHKLQAYAKRYMLDPIHPERKTFVGNRGQTDAAQVRHDLQKCVREFLEAGPGQEFFGPGAESPSDSATRSFSWPADKELIVQLCLPLLRRMVVNERQRTYALKTRKENKAQTDDDSVVRMHHAPDNLSLHSDQQTRLSVQLYIMDQTGKHKLGDRLDSTLSIEDSWEMVKQKISQAAEKALSSDTSRITSLSAHVLVATGLEELDGPEVWRQASQAARDICWLESTIKVIVSVSTET